MFIIIRKQQSRVFSPKALARARPVAPPSAVHYKLICGKIQSINILLAFEEKGGWHAGLIATGGVFEVRGVRGRSGSRFSRFLFGSSRRWPPRLANTPLTLQLSEQLVHAAQPEHAEHEAAHAEHRAPLHCPAQPHRLYRAHQPQEVTQHAQELRIPQRRVLAQQLQHRLLRLQQHPRYREEQVVRPEPGDSLAANEGDGAESGGGLEGEEEAGLGGIGGEDVLHQIAVVLLDHIIAQYHLEKSLGHSPRMHRAHRCHSPSFPPAFPPAPSTGPGLSSAYPAMNVLATSFSLRFCSALRVLHSAMRRRHSCSICGSSLLTFSRSSTASSQARLCLRATPLRQRFLTLAESLSRTWLAKVMTISQRLERRQQSARLEQAGRMTVLSRSAISPFSARCCTLCFRMNSNVITAFENSFVAPSWSPSPSSRRPTSQHSCAIFRCRWNSSSGDSRAPSPSNFSSSPSSPSQPPDPLPSSLAPSSLLLIQQINSAIIAYSAKGS